jgi:hypothetical protein
MRKDKLTVRSTLASISQLKHLITATQIHRGLSAIYLHGDHSVKDDLADIKQEIKIIDENITERGLIIEKERWIAYVDHWQRLKEHGYRLHHKVNLQEHTSLIENCLNLLEEVAEELRYVKLSGIKHHQAQFLWRELPLTIEYIGQARAVGASVCAAKVCTPIDKVKLSYLHDKIKHYSKIAFNTLGSVHSHTTNADIEQTKKHVEELCRVILKELIEKNEIKLNAKTYFATATATIEKFNILLDSEIDYLRQLTQ